MTAPEEEGYKPSFKSELTVGPALEGESVKLKCKVSGKPKPTIKWYKDGNEIPMDTRVKATFDGANCELHISDLTLDDIGNYKCKVENDFGTVYKTVDLFVERKKTKPEILKEMDDVVITEGENARLEVKLKGYPTPEVEWFRGRRKIKPDDRITIDSPEEGTYVLNIKNATLDDSNEYKLVASNDAGDTKVKGEVLIKEKTEHPTFEDVDLKEPLEVDKNEGVSVDFKIHGKPKPVVVWYKDDKPLKETSNRTFYSKGDLYNMTIPAATPEDEGKYRCEATNEVGSTSKTFEVKVKGNNLKFVPYVLSVAHLRYMFLVPKPKGDPPKFTSELSPISATEGDKIKLLFEVTGKPTPDVKWFKDGEPLEDRKGVMSSFERGAGTLQLRNVTLNDQGRYKCVVTNEFGSVETETDVTIDKKKTRPEITEKMKDISIDEGDKAKFKIKCVGHPPPDVEWYHGSEKLREDDKYKILKVDDDTFILEINDIEPGDEGGYKCIASNDAGSVNARAQLKVKERVFAPEFENTPEDKIITENDELEVVCTVKANPNAEVTWYKDGKKIFDSRSKMLRSRGPAHTLYLTNASPDDSGTYTCEAKNRCGKSSCTFEVKVEREYYPYYYKKLSIFFTSVFYYSFLF